MAMAAMLLPQPHLLRMSPEALSLEASSSSNGVPSSGESSAGPSPTELGPTEVVGAMAPEDGEGYNYNLGVSLKCPACNDKFTNPKVLSSCFHTFCEECLAKAQESPNKIVCPSCRTPSFVSLDGVKGLTTDYAIANLLEQRMLADSTLACSSCKTASNGGETAESSKVVVAHCHECSAILCANCFQSHQRMVVFASHQVVPVGPRSASQPPMKINKWLKCPRHRTLYLDRYCLTCTRPTCKDCATMNHVGHEIFDLNDSVAGEVQRMIEMTQIAVHKTADLRMSMRNIEQSCIQLKKEYNEARDQVSETYKYFMDVLLEQQQHSLRKLDVAYNDKEVILGHTAQEMQQNINRAKTCCDFVQKLVTYSSPGETLECRNMIMSKLEEIVRYRSTVGESPMVYGLKFIAHREKIQDHDSMLRSDYSSEDNAAVTNSFGEVHEQFNSPTISPSAGQTSEQLMEVLLSAMQTQDIGGQAPNVGFQAHNAGFQAHEAALTQSTRNSGLSFEDLSLLRQLQSEQQNTAGPVMKYQGGPSAFQPNYQGSASSYQGGGTSNYQGGGATGYQGGSSSYQGQNYPTENSIGSGYGRNSVNAVAFAAMQAATTYRSGKNSTGSPLSNIDSSSQYGNWGGNRGSLDDEPPKGDIFSSAGMFNAGDVGETLKPARDDKGVPAKSQIQRTKMVYTHKFGEFGQLDGQFTEPSGVAVNMDGDILVADTNNHRIQVFSPSGEFKFHFGQHGKRDGQLLYPNRVVVCKVTGNIIVTERAPTHQVQVFSQDGVFIRKFGCSKLQHPRGIAVDNRGRIIIVECKVMRIMIFDSNGNELHKFGCTQHLEFPNGVVVNDREEIFISDNRSHCVKVFSYAGEYLRQIGQEGLTNYPIGVGINHEGHVIIADNHNNFNITAFTQDGQMVAAMESRVKHAQCFDVALGAEGSIVLASRDFRIYVYNFEKVMDVASTTPLLQSRLGGHGMLPSVSPSNFSAPSPSLFSGANSSSPNLHGGASHSQFNVANNSLFSGSSNNLLSGSSNSLFSGSSNTPFGGGSNNPYVGASNPLGGAGSNQFNGGNSILYGGASNNQFSGLSHAQFSGGSLNQFTGANNSPAMIPPPSMSGFDLSRLPELLGMSRQSEMFRQPEMNLLAEMNRQSEMNRQAELPNWFSQQRNY